jgi:hypothetical protein
MLFISYELAVKQACTKANGLGEATPVGIINMIADTLSGVMITALSPILKYGETRDSHIALGMRLQMIAVVLILLVKRN